MLEPAQRNRALLLALAAVLGGMLWFLVGAKLIDVLKLADGNLHVRGALLALTTAGPVGGMIFALRRLSVARDRQWDLRGSFAALLMVPVFFMTIAMVSLLAMTCYVAVTGERLSLFGG